MIETRQVGADFDSWDVSVFVGGRRPGSVVRVLEHDGKAFLAEVYNGKIVSLMDNQGNITWPQE